MDPLASLKSVAVPSTYAFAVIVIFGELLLLLALRRRVSHRSGATSLASGALTFSVLFAADKLFYGALYALAYEHRLVTLGLGVGAWVVTAVVYDLMFYTSHRAGHEVRLFWCFHSVHHTTEEMRLAAAVRGSAFDFVYAPWFFVWIPVIGVHPSMLIIVESFARMWGILTHVSPELVGRLGWLDRVLVTPSVHRVHHGNELAYLDRNYGEILLLWDRLLGTYQREESPPTYGLVKRAAPDDLVAIQLHPLRDLFRDLRRTPGFTARLRVLFDAPGWSPEKDERVRTQRAAAR